MYSLGQFPLPFAEDALAPYMSPRTLNCHHGRHLATYIANLNDLIAGGRYENMPLIEIIMAAANDADAKKIFNNAAQVFNHNFFFHCLRAHGGGVIPQQIADAFGGADEFKKRFRDAALSVFGSGWTWLIKKSDGVMAIQTTANADTPLAHGATPLLTLDVWEHAYYLDYQNRRAEFVDAFLNHMVNWDFVLENISL